MAAVVGGTVPLDILAVVHPLMDAPAALAGDLQRLAAAHFLRPADSSGAVWLWNQVRMIALLLRLKYNFFSVQQTKVEQTL